MSISEDAVEAVAKALNFHLPDNAHEAGCAMRCGYAGDELSEHLALHILEAAAPHIVAQALNEAVGVLGGEDDSLWTRLYDRFAEQDGGDLSSDSTAYLSGVAEAMAFLQERATRHLTYKNGGTE